MTTGQRSYSIWLAYTSLAGTNFDTADAGGPAGPVYMVSRPGRIRQVELTLPPGSAGTLHIVPYVVGRAGARTSALQFAAGGVQYLSGDDVIIRLDADFPVEIGDKVQGWYDNQDPSNPHWFGLGCTVVPEGAGA